MTGPDWLDEGRIEIPADHEDAFRTMDEMRESLRRLTDRAKLQNEKLRAAVELGELAEDGDGCERKPGETGAS